MVASSGTDRGALEREQFNERANYILADISDNLSQIQGPRAAEFIESILKPAYALLRAMQTSSTAFHLAWPRQSNGEKRSPEELAKFTLRNVGSGGDGVPPADVYVVHDLYPVLAINMPGEEAWEILEQAVVIVSWSMPNAA